MHRRQVVGEVIILVHTVRFELLPSGGVDVCLIYTAVYVRFVSKIYRGDIYIYAIETKLESFQWERDKAS